MDQKELQEKIALYYSKLPPDAQAVFSSMKWLETLKTISQKYGLNEKQIETLGTETTLVLLGIIHLVEYEEVLTNEIKLSREFAEKMLLEIEESIIKTIRPQLIHAFEAKKNSEIGEESNIEPKLDERFEKLPLETRNIITQSNYRAILYNIAKEYNLNVEQTGILETFTTNLVTGAIRPDEFENSLKKNIGLPLETVGKLANDINEGIFKKIREELVKGTERKKSLLDSEKIDTSILNQAGIEIVPARKAYTGKESKETLPVPEKLELTTILAQKLSGPSRIPITKTEYSLNNITKTTSIPVPQAPKAYPKNADPYRLIPEE